MNRQNRPINGQPMQPPTRSVPEYAPPPQNEISYSDEPINSDCWSTGFYWGAFIGIGIGMLLMKLFIKFTS
ncbi:hypothetical protein OHV66_06555 [Acinetobacter baumannii]|uniref:hypothetical protein n=1 Tax=Acinetobacter calcoaceticus/baumannii complex TaxID=909768 RepID=UPI000571A82C|nr:hypothetical protein [Acinetobacter baumannii]EHU2215484.1 hypothetical protein [Acinetobacter baumannii]EJD6467134.1 hypothetical protein [Acinetobacter baumannii]EKV4977673.1 hypothetical protein [Acinetobacter baumannii]EKV6568348.1 hypothetical protein [Acinetobacter baumannii]EKW9250762.1 hypothetical protein [Acinetobacter baumannii]